jgi:integrase
MAVRKRGKKWTVDIRQGKSGRRFRVTFDGTEGEALEFEAAIRRELGRERRYNRSTIGSLAPQYLEFVRNNQSPVTYRGKENMLRLHILPFFGNMYFEQIPSFVVERYKTKRKKEISSKVSNGGARAINLELLCLAAMARWYGCPLTVKQIPHRSAMPSVWTKDEVNRLIDALPPFHRAMALCMYHAGMRKQEVLTLTWNRVILEASVIVALGKGDKERIIPMTPFVTEALQALPRTNSLVFPSPKTGCPMVNVYKKIRATAKKIGIMKRIYPHLLRHCFGTHIYRETGDLQAIQRLMGHAAISTTQIYAKVETDHLKDVMDRGLVTIGHKGAS